MKTLGCVEHHLHDEKNPTPAPTQHTPIKIESEWRFCPLCGRQVR